MGPQSPPAEFNPSVGRQREAGGARGDPRRRARASARVGTTDPRRPDTWPAPTGALSAGGAPRPPRRPSEAPSARWPLSREGRRRYRRRRRWPAVGARRHLPAAPARPTARRRARPPRTVRARARGGGLGTPSAGGPRDRRGLSASAPRLRAAVDVAREHVPCELAPGVGGESVGTPSDPS